MSNVDHLTDRQRDVVAVLREGRATPRYILEETSIDHRNTVQTHLGNLRAEGVVRKVSRGLYELAPPHHTDIDTSKLQFDTPSGSLDAGAER